MKSFVTNLLESTKAFSPAELACLEDFLELQKKDNESVLKTLARLGYVQATAERTFDLISKGYISQAELAMIFCKDKLLELKSQLLNISRATTPLDGQDLEQNSPWETQKHKLDGKIPAEVGKMFGKCLITGLLGRGGNGIVYSALHRTLNIPVAVKVIVDEGVKSEKTRAILRKEAQLLARLNHPNIVRVLDFDDGEIPFFVMEMVEGPTLAELIDHTGGVQVLRAAEIMLETVNALKAAKNIGIVHRDIKPANILLAKTGEAKVADLGLAFIQDAGEHTVATPSGLPIGTCAYMSPEQIRSVADIDYRTDMYSLGATYYHAVTGHLPFQSKNPREVLMKHLAETPTRPCDIAKGIVDTFTSDIIMKLLQKNPDERYESYEELTSDLVELIFSLKGNVETVSFDKNVKRTETTPDFSLRANTGPLPPPAPRKFPQG